MTERANIRRIEMLEGSAIMGRIDMDREMPPGRLKALAELYELERARGLFRALKIAASLRILSPDNPALAARPDAGFVEDLTNRKRSEEWYQFSEEAAQMRLAFPAYAPPISKSDWEKVERYWRRSPPFSTPLENTIALAYRTRIVFPDSKVNVTDADLKQLTEIINVLREQRRPDEYLACCVERKILFPEHAFEFSDSEWQFMRDALRNPHIMVQLFAERASNVKIIAAADVRITTGGLQITVTPKDTEARKQKMPEQLNI